MSVIRFALLVKSNDITLRMIVKYPLLYVVGPEKGLWCSFLDKEPFGAELTAHSAWRQTGMRDGSRSCTF